MLALTIEVDPVALYGAVLATAALLWQVSTHVRDRGRLRITGFVGELMGRGVEPGQGRITVCVTNAGSKAVYLQTVGGRTPKGRFIWMFERLDQPQLLKPGAQVSLQSHDFANLRDGLKYLSAHDTLGREFRTSRRQTRRFIESLAALPSPDTGDEARA